MWKLWISRGIIDHCRCAREIVRFRQRLQFLSRPARPDVTLTFLTVLPARGSWQPNCHFFFRLTAVFSEFFFVVKFSGGSLFHEALGRGSNAVHWESPVSWTQTVRACGRGSWIQTPMNPDSADHALHHILSSDTRTPQRYTQHARYVHAQCGANPCTHGYAAVSVSKRAAAHFVPLLLRAMRVVPCFRSRYVHGTRSVVRVPSVSYFEEREDEELTVGEVQVTGILRRRHRVLLSRRLCR